MKFDASISLLALFACLTAGAVTPAAVYSKCETNVWFAVEPTDLGTPGNAIEKDSAAGGEGTWSAVPSEGEATYGGTDAARTVSLDTDPDDPLTFTATSAYSGSEVALVKTRFVVSAGVSMPSADDFSSAQAALAAYTNTQTGAMNWIGLVNGDDGAEWVTFEQTPAAVGETAEVIIEFDNRAETKKIRYSVKEGTGDDAAFVVLTTSSVTDGWFTNAMSGATSQSGLSFSGTGTFDLFTGDQVYEASRATLAVQDMTMGFDYTNGTVKVDVSDYHRMTGVSATTLYLTVTDKDGATVGSTSKVVSGAGTGVISFELPTDLVAGERYTYTVQLKETIGDTERSVAVSEKSDLVYAGTSASWFDAKSGRWDTDGTWKDGTETALDPQPSGDSIVLDGAERTFVPKVASAGQYVRVDSDVEFTGVFDVESITGAQGAITLAATSDDDDTPVWKAWVKDTDGGQWVSLTGVDATIGRKTIRAEFDYETQKVRYSILTGTAFTALKDASGNEWLDNVDATTKTLTKVTVAYKGMLYELKGENGNHDLASAGGSTYTNLCEALATGSDVTLLWDVTYVPGDEGEWTVVQNGKKLEFVGDTAWRAIYEDGKIRVAVGYVAQIGSGKYLFLDKAFAAIAGDSTLQLLTNVVTKLSYVYPDASTAKVALDLNGWCLVSNMTVDASITVPSGAGLTVTNTASTQGAFDLALAGEGEKAIAGGLYTDSATNVFASALRNGYQFIAVAYQTNLYDRTFVAEARRFEGTAEQAAAVIVVPSVNTSETNVAEVIVNKEWAVQNASVSFDTPERAQLAVETLNSKAANDITYVDNYALGLDPKTATSKPVTLPVQNTDADTIKFKIGNIAPRSDAGVQVNYCVEEYESPSAATPAKTSDKISADQSTEVALPDSGNVRYYKIRLILDPKN